MVQSFHVTPMIISFRIFLWKAKLSCLLYAMLVPLTHWGRATHICVGNLTIIGSDNGLWPGRRQAIIWTNVGIFLIRPLGTNFSEILIGNQTFSFMKMHLKMSSAKWRPFFLSLNVLTHGGWVTHAHVWANWAVLVQIMACSLIDTKPLSESMVVYCQLDP